MKCRIGVDDQVPENVLPEFLDRISAAGVARVAIHARKAWLQGLSPKQNRDVPPLDYPLVQRMKAEFPDLHISINGGIATLDEAKVHLDAGLERGHDREGRLSHARRDPRARPMRRSSATPPRPAAPKEAVLAMLPYIERHLCRGGRLQQVTRHMLGLFAGRPGARGWKRVLSEGAHRDGAGPELVEQALSEVTLRAA